MLPAAVDADSGPADAEEPWGVSTRGRFSKGLARGAGEGAPDVEAWLAPASPLAPVGTTGRWALSSLMLPAVAQ